MHKKVKYFRTLLKPIKNDLIINGPAFPTSSVVVDKKILKKLITLMKKKILLHGKILMRGLDWLVILMIFKK